MTPLSCLVPFYRWAEWEWEKITTQLVIDINGFWQQSSLTINPILGITLPTTNDAVPADLPGN